MLKFYFFLVLVAFIHSGSKCQLVKGHIIDGETNQALVYASIGIVNTTFGAITNNNGYFEFKFKATDSLSKVRVSMIGYEPQTFTLDEVLHDDLQIKLKAVSYNIDEIVIKPSVESILGARGYNRLAGWSGWNSRHTRKGNEIGIKLDLGDEPVKLKSVHVMLHRQAFDTSYYRLHIRRMDDTLVLNELLTENIIIPISVESGWAAFDLQQFNLIFSGEIVCALEMIKAKGLNADREMKINDRLQKNYILLKNKKKHTGVYRFGPEAQWNVNTHYGPSIYLAILK